MKIHPVGVELFYADGQTDMTKLIVAFRNSVGALEKDSHKYLITSIANKKGNSYY